MKKYIRFGAMILTSTIVMYFLMYLNVFEFSHATLSETRIYMSILMGATMAVIMMLFMWHMYDNKKLNGIILASAAVIFGVSLFLVRSQTIVDQVSWMKAMIPHHSIAILTSERANIEDERVQELADEIIQAQKEEIDEMKQLIEELENE
ncbi:DUF305 domain-containing protein [Alkalibacterium sp. 20]|uniref:DUF305 domain-containing protein n=1 Tax=Alkalibacterium sp. 20 TaxID=1798803 RepID=UPI0008FFE8B4|nr:DUF305 domain-containing protein [Alkalibacterium sp. 20]OJF92597.1 DUF305 domain-containing protein [Alkalibacterium sp. 20]